MDFRSSGEVNITGLSYLVIEQVFMRNIKTSGGLARGRGMTEIQRLIWLHALPALIAMQS